MTITTAGIVAHTLPSMTKTLFQHFYTQLKKNKEDRRTQATDELLFHEAFTLLKKVMNYASHDTVEAMQTFTNTHVPYQPWSTVVPCIIPLSSCDDAAKIMIDWFGPQDLKQTVGGEKWWQIRGLSGIEAEWIAQSSDFRDAKSAAEMMEKAGPGISKQEIKARISKGKVNARHERQPKKPKLKKSASTHSTKSRARDDSTEAEIEAEDFEEINRLKRTMLYIHGGAYYVGSINTHRFMLVRFARKFGGRVFACNYRKAPGFPFPCAIQDCLASYLYLIRPPPEAKHQAVDPADIVIAGDSAGAGMALAMMTILRDQGLPQPAGAVLISPWSDLVHSCKSILENTQTDYIPDYGFQHKPSTLWPVPAIPNPEPDIRKPKKRFSFMSRPASPTLGVPTGVSSIKEDVDTAANVKPSPGPSSASLHPPEEQHSSEKTEAEQAARSRFDDEGIPFAPKHLPAEIVRVPVSGEANEVELRAQIQIYATNEQIFHPLCSPILQGSLGGLPPLYIIASDSEVLRDEIIHLAHRAARPAAYPLNDEILARNPRNKKTAERFNGQPTKVHLQVYDEQCHVLTMFAFTTQARFAYRAIASFVKHVTGAATDIVNPFLDIQSAPRQNSEVPSDPQVHNPDALDAESNSAPSSTNLKPAKPTIDTSHITVATEMSGSPATMGRSQSGPGVSSPDGPHDSKAFVDSPIIDAPPGSKDELQARRRRNASRGGENVYSGIVPLKRPTFSPTTHMVRERVNVRGDVRPLEPEAELQGCRITDVGIIKEGPVRRYLEGVRIWGEKFAKEAKKVEKRRAKNEAKARVMLKKAAVLGLLGTDHPPRGAAEPGLEGEEAAWTDLAKFGPMDISDETPPPSALAGRRDTEDALQLLRTSLHMRAKNAGIRVGKRQRAKDAIFGASAPKQSAAEAQVIDRSNATGLKFWSFMMGGTVLSEASGAEASGSSGDSSRPDDKRRSSQRSVKKFTSKPRNEDAESDEDEPGTGTYGRGEWVDETAANTGAPPTPKATAKVLPSSSTHAQSA